jgi:hypothetical protein
LFNPLHSINKPPFGKSKYQGWREEYRTAGEVLKGKENAVRLLTDSATSSTTNRALKISRIIQDLSLLNDIGHERI